MICSNFNGYKDPGSYQFYLAKRDYLPKKWRLYDVSILINEGERFERQCAEKLDYTLLTISRNYCLNGIYNLYWLNQSGEIKDVDAYLSKIPIQKKWFGREFEKVRQWAVDDYKKYGKKWEMLV